MYCAAHQAHTGTMFAYLWLDFIIFAIMAKPHKFTESVRKSILDKLSQGESIWETCASVGVSVHGLRALVLREPEFKALYDEAISQGDMVHQTKVKDFSRESYLKRLRGYTVKETTTTKDADGNVISVVEKTRHIPANVNLILAAAQRLEPFMRDEGDGGEAVEPLPKIVFNCPPRTDGESHDASDE